MVRLAIHALSEAAITLLLTTVAAELVHVVSVVRVVVVWVVVWVTPVLGLLVVTLVVALRSRARRKLVAESRVGSVVTAVRRLSVTALLALRERVLGPGAKAAAGTLLSSAGLLLAWCLLAVVLVVLLVCVALLLRSEVLGVVIRRRGEGTRL